ncbi:UDP-N-acetyl-D-mannosamine dehydrogenase [uncultured Prochlorococcus sp.]|uniref:UDP-N-acetyl-D-mannosamine dehydrogenase n=1 Tax=uncultured Prochlorococcus sp. TaxID=159733 RepID=UPI0025829807|nr:UDP-N-acetyl-D-mannosamine dehydrogenase [uncultured Prochlorococcus sp.]
MAKCCIFGLGYIGLPTAAVLCDAGHQVFGVDTNLDVVESINSGKVHIFEPNLEEKISKYISSGDLKASITPSKAEIFIIAVPTPFNNSKNRIPIPNIDYVISASKTIASVIKEGDIVILESTCPIGTTRNVYDLISKISKVKNFHLAYCPERVLPGNILKELVSNSRVIGGLNQLDSDKIFNFYKTFCEGKIIKTDSKTAELVKLSENAFRDVNIAFANEMSIICNKLGVNPWELINICNQHPRVNILNPGCGVGGHCIAIDPWFIAHKFPEETKLIQQARNTNNQKSEWVITQIETKSRELSLDLSKKIKIGCFGLSFKPDIDDLRESPALKIVLNLIEKGLDVIVCEPNINSHTDFDLCDFEIVEEKADLLVFLVNHSKFKTKNINKKPILDYCGLLN